MMAPETYVGGIRIVAGDVARPQGVMERTQPDHDIGIDLQDARTRTATGNLTSA